MNKDAIYSDLSPDEGKKGKYKWDLYAKNKYCPDVKMSNWWYYRENFPKDYPLGDVTQSSYKRLGTYKEDKTHWQSETAASMAEGPGDPILNELRDVVHPPSILTFLSYPRTDKTRKDFLPNEIREMLPALPKDLLQLRYETTNRSHYKPCKIIVTEK